MKLLIVNDEKMTADMMKESIQWESYGISRVYTAYDVSEAKECIQENNPEILLCDIEMPGENGIDLLRWVRDENKEIECIFLTCHAIFDYAQEAIKLGCQDYILIPAKYETVANAVHKVVKRIQQKEREKGYKIIGEKVVKEKVEAAAENFGEKRTPEEIVSEVEKYIGENIGNEELSLVDVSEKMYLHPAYLNRIFKKQKGTSIGKYIINVRMEFALVLLREGKLSANTIAEQVGYKSYSNFCLAFKKMYGCSPTNLMK